MKSVKTSSGLLENYIKRYFTFFCNTLKLTHYELSRGTQRIPVRPRDSSLISVLYREGKWGWTKRIHFGRAKKGAWGTTFFLIPRHETCYPLSCPEAVWTFCRCIRTRVSVDSGLPRCAWRRIRTIKRCSRLERHRRSRSSSLTLVVAVSVATKCMSLHRLNFTIFKRLFIIYSWHGYPPARARWVPGWRHHGHWTKTRYVMCGNIYLFISYEILIKASHSPLKNLSNLVTSSSVTPLQPFPWPSS